MNNAVDKSWPADRIERRPIDSLVAYSRNARTHSEAQIAQVAASMQRFGWTSPVLVGEDGTLIAGHARVQAARLLGWTEVPCMLAAGWTAEERRAYVLADNQLALNAGWDADLLRFELEALAASGFAMDLLGFEDLAALMAPRHGGLTDPDALPEVGPAVARLGEVWLLGRHRLVCGDATEADTVALALAGVSPHLMVTDPPYGVEYDPGWRARAGVGSAGAATIKVANDDRADWRAAWRLFPGAVAYVWHGGLHAAVAQESLSACRFQVRAQIVWVKTRAALSRGHYHWQHEPALYAVREDAADDGWRFHVEHDLASYAVREGQAGAWHGGRKQSTVWFIEHLKNDTGHSTQKPVECMRRPMENNSNPGQAVYDPFVGSGTSIIAAEMSGRVCLALDLTPACIDMAVRRWQDFTGSSAVREADGRSFDELSDATAETETDALEDPGRQSGRAAAE